MPRVMPAWKVQSGEPSAQEIGGLTASSDPPDPPDGGVRRFADGGPPALAVTTSVTVGDTMRGRRGALGDAVVI